jgi:hypothetical protein
MRASVIGAGLMTTMVAIAIYVVPAAEAPEPTDVGCIRPLRLETGLPAECGGDTVPFLTHEHRDASGVVTRFELFPRGEWRLSTMATGNAVSGCTDATTLEELSALATAATWKRQHRSTACDVRPSGTEAWLVAGVERLAYNVCDREQPDPQTEKVIELVLNAEALNTPQVLRHGDCPNAALACYEWLGTTSDGTPPEIEFVVEDSGAWELTQRDVQSDEITVHKTGALAAAEVRALRDRIAHASWTLVKHQACGASNNVGVGTIAVHGHSVIYGPCSIHRPDRPTQRMIDQLFAIYRSALRSKPHI